MIHPSVRIEGAILSPDILDRLEDQAGQRPVDFGMDASIKVKDEIVRAWADAQDYWRIFRRKLDSLREESVATTETRQQWVLPLLGLLGYQLDFQAKSAEVNGKLYPLSHRIANRGGTVVHIIGYRDPAGLDKKAEQRSGAMRMSAHAMVQEYLNLSDELYGLVTNGRVLRLLRDSSRLIKLTYLEFDLDRVFTDGLFADFALLYRLLHSSRLPANHDDAAQSWIEHYHQDSLDAGSRIREGLSKAVEQAISGLANGFLQHADNDALRLEVTVSGQGENAFYKCLLHLIYRLLFLMVIEERGLVFPVDATARNRHLYEQYYSLMRLRRMSEKRHLADRRHVDLWPALLTTFRLFEADGRGRNMGMAPLAGDLFSSQAIGSLAQCTLGNDVLLKALRSLNLYTHPDNGQLIRVNYGALNVEEFGSVYEGLLEYEPAFVHDGPRTEFQFRKGDERANTGSHYTPDELVQPLIKHSLDHLIEQKLKETDPAKSLLELRVVDVACGSGHILLAAARRIATELAIVRTGEDQPSPSAFRGAIREVIRHCIYGVDLNPLAAELCKVALWLEAHNPGEPLNFLDHRVKCGNAIVGYVRRDDIDHGVPDEAFATLPSDDKEVATSLRKRNKLERKGQNALRLSPEIERHLGESLKSWRALDALPEDTPEQIDAKKQRFLGLTQSADALLMERLAAIPVAQFYIPKRASRSEQHITDGEFRRYWKGERVPQGGAAALSWEVSERKRFFHWFLAFPEVMAQGGFDCVLGNPPYLGGQALSGTFGHSFCEYVKWAFAPAGISDLVVYFVRRTFRILRPGGFTAFITTNSIKDGDNRRDGLDQVILGGGVINMAIRAHRWPGRANVVVSILAIHNGPWSGPRYLDGRDVREINAYFEADSKYGDPQSLGESSGRIYQGSIFLGDGFLLDDDEANALLSIDDRYREVVFPVINGKEANSDPLQRPARFIINFHDWDEATARSYEGPFKIVEERVKPERLKQKDGGARTFWWRFLRPRMEMTRAIVPLKWCFCTARVTKYLNYSAMPTSFVFLNNLYVLTSDRWDIFAVVQSTLHEVWARKYSMSLEQRLQYSPSDCFETFAFPGALWDRARLELAAIGERYHEHRKVLMIKLSLGLTDLYNLFHAPNLSVSLTAKISKQSNAVAQSGYEGVLELRRLHAGLDNLVRDAYGWSDLTLNHGFAEVETLPENDRVRYTISSMDRKEVLKRLLELNHERVNTDVKQQAEDALAKKQRRSVVPIEQSGSLFASAIELDWSSLPSDAWARIGSQADDELANLAAVMKILARPTPKKEVRLVALLCMEPNVLLPLLSVDQARSWRRLVGAEVQPLPSGVAQFTPVSRSAWGSALSQLRGDGSLIEDTIAGTWGPGGTLAGYYTEGWPDGRAAFVVKVLSERGIDAMLQALPPEARDRIYADAA